MDLDRFKVYTLGIHQIDEEHLRLLNKMSALMLLPRAPDLVELVSKALDELVGLTKVHFANEETLMVSSEYPYVAWHREVHKVILVEIARLISQHVEHARSGYVTSHFYKELQRIMLSHIDEHDRQLARWILKN